MSFVLLVTLLLLHYWFYFFVDSGYLFSILYAIGLECPRVWDGLLCWPPTPANVTSLLACPDYVDGFNVLVSLIQGWIRHAISFWPFLFSIVFFSRRSCITQRLLDGPHFLRPWLEATLQDSMDAVKPDYIYFFFNVCPPCSPQHTRQLNARIVAM